MSTDLKVQIPESHYAGFVQRNKNDPVLGFITPYEDNSAGRKRQSTVDGWRDNKIPTKIMPNVLMSGFKISDVNRGYKDKSDTWRIVDPRGFELEIYSGNLSEILSNNTVENGEIICKCIWGRAQGVNLLLSENSEVYQNALKNTERSKKSVSMRELKPGMSIVLHNGMVGEYMGKYFTATLDYSYDDYDNSRRSSGQIMGISEKKKHFFVVVNDQEHWRTGKQDKYIAVLGSPKLSEITDSTTKTIKECEAYIGKLIKEGCTFVDGYRSSIWHFLGASTSRNIKPSYKLVPIDIDLHVKSGYGGYEGNAIVVENSEGTLAITNNRGLLQHNGTWKNGDDIEASCIDADKLRHHSILEYITDRESIAGYGSFSRNRHRDVTRMLEGNKNDLTWYSLRVCYTNPETSNDFELPVRH